MDVAVPSFSFTFSARSDDVEGGAEGGVTKEADGFPKESTEGSVVAFPTLSADGTEILDIAASSAFTSPAEPDADSDGAFFWWSKDAKSDGGCFSVLSVGVRT